MTAFHTANEAGWLTAGQAQAFDLSWLVRPGTPLSSLLTGVLGIQPYPAWIEVVGLAGLPGPDGDRRGLARPPPSAGACHAARRRGPRTVTPSCPERKPAHPEGAELNDAHRRNQHTTPRPADLDDRARCSYGPGTGRRMLKRLRRARVIGIGGGLGATSARPKPRPSRSTSPRRAARPGRPALRPARSTSPSPTRTPTAVSEAELRTSDLSKILGEQENLTPGLSGGFSLDIQPGSYTINCPGATQQHWTFTVTGSANRPVLAVKHPAHRRRPGVLRATSTRTRPTWSLTPRRSARRSTPAT